MKEYIKMLVDGCAHISLETQAFSYNDLFRDENFDTIPFEGNTDEVWFAPDKYLAESYYPNSEDEEIYIQTTEDANGGMVITFSDHGKQTHQFVEKHPESRFDVFEYLNADISELVSKALRNGSMFLRNIGGSRFKPVIYKLCDAWLIFNDESRRNGIGINIIAGNIERAREIEAHLLKKMNISAANHRNRYECFMHQKHLDEFNASEECNRLRHKYLLMIKKAYESLDFSELFEYLDEDCSWGGNKGKAAVIAGLKESPANMRKNNYFHRCTIVQISEKFAPLEFNTKSFRTRKRCLARLMYNEGELCMVHETPHQNLFFRLALSVDGKIASYYATLPSGHFRPI